MGSLAHNAISGKTIIRRICKKDGRKFITQYLLKPVILSQREYEKVGYKRTQIERVMALSKATIKNYLDDYPYK